MAGALKSNWFGKQVTVLMVNGKSVTGEVAETSDSYIVLDVSGEQMQIMVHAIIAVRLASAAAAQQ